MTLAQDGWLVKPRGAPPTGYPHKMMKAVLDTRPGSGYADTAERYQFPRRYLEVALAAQGEWIVLYEPRREGGRAAYVAAARLAAVEPDATRAGHHVAILTDYLPFDRAVPLKGPDGYREAPLRQVADSRAVGRALQGRAVRPLADADFSAIVGAGLASTLSADNLVRVGMPPASLDPDTLALIEDVQLERRMERALASRLIRDAAFRRAVLDAYDDTCAATGLRMVNGGGRSEAQAAHIVPVAEGGPDIVQNGIALSATAHWLFDRHLISIAPDYSLLVSHNRVPAPLRSLFHPQEQRIRLPADRRNWPHPALVARHRERFTSG